MTAHDRDTTPRASQRIDRRTILRYGAASAGLAAAARVAGPTAAQDATPAAPAASGFNTAALQVSGPVEIEYWQYELTAKTQLVNELIPEFQAANPGITVKHVNFPYDDFRQQVAAAVQAGEGPDVLNVYYGWIPAYVQQQFLVPLPEDVFPAATIEADYFPMVTAAKVGGSYYALPTAVRTLALFYNRDLLGAAGVQPPTNWEETVAVAKATARKNGDNFEVVGITWDIGGQGHNWWREALTRQNGLVPYSEDNRTLYWSNPEGVEAFNYLASFLTEHGVTQSGFQTDGPTAFAAGSAALHVDGSYRVGSLAIDAPDLNYGIVPLPAHKTQASFASFWANTITRNAAEGDKLIASQKFIDFLSSEAVQRRWTPRIGELPARQALAAEPELVNNEKLAPFIQSLPFSYATFLVNEADLRQAVIDAFDQVVLNGLDTESAIQEAQARVQTQLDEYWATFG
ncbi:MAG: Maltose/maltodextrin ABC transporter, substrate binding periplasmic protein MalE [uncultured Thermomicrobiales bacterium]|uniref:Maltose/maltodextrin ABC transporter, substrate binding periplasmic protein MalE n=1 Tax=uncultured Thermomicrobiales bacterium TaxID=1645740 RepID=A0A6J4TYY1_9BACT|nr:MAG: Maltose/maltodextrin ABC transporter, substrate binding periplasmic protein MalE [uncultured Thermomicrobiales bacterium]